MIDIYLTISLTIHLFLVLYEECLVSLVSLVRAIEELLE